MNKVLRLLLLFVCGLSAARAQFVTINFQSSQLTDSTGTPLANGSLVVLLANVASPTTAGAGFSTLSAGSLNVGDLLNNGAYQVLGRAAVDAFSFDGEFTGSTGSIQLGGLLFPNLSTGDQLAVAWFPSLSETTDFSMATATSYGLYTLDLSSVWQTPSPASTIDVEVPFATAALLTAVPEPATYAALAGALVLGLALHRKRRRTA